MNYFPNNTPDHFQTKVAYPITLNGEWECCLREVTISGKYFTIHPDYNDSYSLETIENVESSSLTPEFVIPLYNEDYQEFTEGVNANVKKLIEDPPITFSLIENKTKIKINVKPYWKGAAIALKEFRKTDYIAFSITVDGEIRNRFNLPLDQLNVLMKGVEAIHEYVKDYN
ncbi:uncharacterized protein TNCV_2177191 [Trichonephila clavipes]|uniref:Uncharacterized protein n=1 Tax=Trichonephila clavipes TaxID=2585209 RepID=A0A8X7B7V8_TRICX|nr:uncharacterized protein TNCV_2177191 [Trichonephila clavipes]